MSSDDLELVRGGGWSLLRTALGPNYNADSSVRSACTFYSWVESFSGEFR